MCGICGIVSDNGHMSPDAEMVGKMMASIRHRGPDDSGVHIGSGVALGHLRLSVIDLDTGRQPIYNEDRTKCIIYNGELYNYLDLRSDLISKGHKFATRSDTETILHLYEHEGNSCVNHLRGMFAFAIWDSKSRKLFIARDRLGIKPVYYASGLGWFCFASEIKALLATGHVDRVFNSGSVDQYLALNYTIGPQTMLANVKKLMPGHYMVYHQGEIETTRYWDFHDIRETVDSFDLCMEKMEHLIKESVRIRLMSEVPLGAFLSGGVDSSVTVGIMTRLTNRPVKTFTVGYENAGEESELGYARQVARHFNSEHHEFVLKPQKFMDVVSKVVWHLDEPVAEFATMPLLLLSELAKKHVTVMLSGEGADEIFAGYPIYRFMNYIEQYRKLPALLRRTMCDPIAAIFLGKKRGGKYMDWLSNPLEKRYLGNGAYFTESMRKKLYTSEFEREINMRDVQRTVASYYHRVENRDAIRKMLYLDTETWLPEDLLIKADKMTMSAALELRVPFLDHHLVEFATSLPSKMKATTGESKYIFKKYAEKILPKEIVYRKKKGFPVPIRQWLREDLYDVARDILLNKKTKERGIFNSSYVEMLFEQHASGAGDFSKNIWNLLILEMWMKIFIDGEAV